MSMQTHIALAGKKPMQIAALVFVICYALWSASFTHTLKEQIILCFVLVGLFAFFEKPIDALEESENPQYVKLKRISLIVSIPVICLPAILELTSLKLGADVSGPWFD